MSLPYNSSAFDTWSVAGPYRPMPPIDRQPETLVFEQDWMGKMSTFETNLKKLDTEHTSIPGVYLVQIGKPSHEGGGIGKATFTYAQIPDPRDEWNTSISFTFPGGSGTWSGEFNVLVIDGVVITKPTLPILGAVRNRQVLARMRYDYWLPGQSPGIVTAADIPIVPAFEIADASDELTTILASDSTPSLTDYESYVAQKLELVAYRSTLSPWMGNIIERVTAYVRAQ